MPIPMRALVLIIVRAALIVCVPSVAVGQTGTESAAQRAAATRPRAGDQIVLNFLREPQLNANLGINERGEAVFPKLGILRVSPLTISQLEDTLRTRYAEFLRAPELQVLVMRRIVVNGEVKLPNVYMLDGASTVRDAVARAGGVTEFGSKGKVAIVRDGKRIPVKGWESDQGPASDLQSGDQVVVGRKSWLIMNMLPVISTAVLVTSFTLQVLK
ncbi:MAG TPA: polysaccharide biosynthesis/export family protein [Gemmatimonadaceae bacterium]|nr:polysaccharide biosynthesis/export family protein [Gemmatimonadaceae bacterium]